MLCLKIFSNRADKENRYMYKIKCRKRLLQIMILSSFIFEENYVFISEDDNNWGKAVTAEEKLDILI